MPKRTRKTTSKTPKRKASSKLSNARISKTRATPSKNRRARFIEQRKLVLQRSIRQNIAVERVRFKFGKGSKPVSSTETAKTYIERARKSATKKFSRKKSTHYTVRVNLKWKGKDGKWTHRSLSWTAKDLDRAMQGVLDNPELNSFDYEVKDRVTKRTKVLKIHSATKRITRISIDKEVSRVGKVSKTPRKKGKKKASRRN